MTATPIQTQAEFEVAIRRLRELGDAPAGTVDATEMEALLLVINAWQDAHPETAPEQAVA